MNNKILTAADIDQLDRVAATPENEIDIVDIPEAPPENWPQARRINDHKGPVMIRLDEDIRSWFKDNAANGSVQTEVNRILRTYMRDTEKRRV